MLIIVYQLILVQDIRLKVNLEEQSHFKFNVGCFYLSNKNTFKKKDLFVLAKVINNMELKVSYIYSTLRCISFLNVLWLSNASYSTDSRNKEGGYGDNLNIFAADELIPREDILNHARASAEKALSHVKNDWIPLFDENAILEDPAGSVEFKGSVQFTPFHN